MSIGELFWLFFSAIQPMLKQQMLEAMQAWARCSPRPRR
ncbi:MAG: hypothetical protein JWP25_6099 [Bradyrhizobium sp.]|nr:hypothetical protein [Bradyrhizobium sp.]